MKITTQHCIAVLCRSVEKREILSHWKKFRQINYSVISLVKPLLSRIFCKKSVRENFCNFHTVCVNIWNQYFSWNHYQLIKCVLNWRNFSMFKFNLLFSIWRKKWFKHLYSFQSLLQSLIQKLLKCGVIAEKYAKGYKRIHQSLLAEWQLKCCM